MLPAEEGSSATGATPDSVGSVPLILELLASSESCAHLNTASHSIESTPIEHADLALITNPCSCYPVEDEIGIYKSLLDALSHDRTWRASGGARLEETVWLGESFQT